MTTEKHIENIEKPGKTNCITDWGEGCRPFSSPLYQTRLNAITPSTSSTSVLGIGSSGLILSPFVQKRANPNWSCLKLRPIQIERKATSVDEPRNTPVPARPSISNLASSSSATPLIWYFIPSFSYFSPSNRKIVRFVPTKTRYNSLPLLVISRDVTSIPNSNRQQLVTSISPYNKYSKFELCIIS